MTSKKLPIGTIVIFGIFLLVMAATYILTKPPERPAELEGVLRPGFKLLQPFKLTDHNNTVFDEKRLQGKWSFVFFGYTSCPDVCPATLFVLNSVHGLLLDESGGSTDDMQVVFVSVDPARDTVNKLADYVTYFNKDFIGTTADKTEIEKLARQFGAGYIFEEETSAGVYNVSHTSAIFLIDPTGRLVASFSQPHQPATIISLYKKIRTYFSWD
ncbi:MAG: SCO family protein [Gammaproteobacteria bacterium]|nr:SCO family protein [Gammaproteobacteria bacterium]